MKNVFKFIRNNKAFTLAEVLITLTILGVIATITIPSAIKNHKRQYTLTKLKLAYSLLSKVVDESIVYNGQVNSWDYSRASSWGSSDKSRQFAQRYLIPGFNVVEECEYGNSNTKCFASLGGNINGFYIDKDGNIPTTYNSPHGSYQFKIKNGMSFAVFVAWKNDYDDPNQARINVDIDGPDKGKSILGEDVFVFQVHKTKGLIPYSANAWGVDHCISGNMASGAQLTGGGHATCAALIIKNGWKFPRNYPFFK